MSPSLVETNSCFGYLLFVLGSRSKEYRIGKWQNRNLPSQHQRTPHSSCSSGSDHFSHIKRWPIFCSKEALLCWEPCSLAGKSLHSRCLKELVHIFNQSFLLLTGYSMDWIVKISCLKLWKILWSFKRKIFKYLQEQEKTQHVDCRLICFIVWHFFIVNISLAAFFVFPALHDRGFRQQEKKPLEPRVLLLPCTIFFSFC